jgi:hypothetical protein
MNLQVASVLGELAKIEHEEIAKAVFELFGAESTSDALRSYETADPSRKLKYQRQIEDVFAKADQRFWQRVRAQDLKIPFPPNRHGGHE